MERPVMDLLQDLPPESRQELERKGFRRSVSPMLATLADEHFSDPAWIFERKLDGERCVAFRQKDDVGLRSRNHEALDDTYPEIRDALEEQEVNSFVVDGEVVAFEDDVTSFSRLQGRMKIEDPEKARKSSIRVFYYLFDLLYLDGHDTTALELRERKALLKEALSFRDPIRLVPHRNGEGEELLEEACDKGWEGIIAKRADSPYVQSRSTDWLKLKCRHRQELVVGGYTEPRGARIGFGALLVGFYHDGDLRYAGKVGTGYDQETLEELAEKLGRLERRTPPFGDERLSAKGVHWVTPQLVVEVAFTEWTDAGKLRHPRYLGLRRDKDPEEVVRER